MDQWTKREQIKGNDQNVSIVFISRYDENY